MQNIRIDIAYDGTSFGGWQAQTNTKTVQGTIEDALKKICQQSIRIHGAGRTDAGVHALKQTATFKVGHNLPLQAFVQGINSHLPPEIRILHAEQVDDDFHAQFSAKHKTYEYYFISQALVHPLWQRYVWNLPFTWTKESTKHMQACLPILKGTHDFKSFCASGSSVKTTVREIVSTSMQPLTARHPIFSGVELYSIKFQATGFLKQMVRNLVGTLIELVRDSQDPDSISAILEKRDRNAAGPTAPAKGLFLMDIYYGENCGNSPASE